MPVPIAELFVSVGADVSGAVAGLAAVGAELTGMGSKFNEAKAGALLLTAAGASIGVAFGGAVAGAADFDTLLVQTRNNTTQTDADMQNMQDTILKLGASAPVPLEELAQGFMHVSNFGFDAAASTAILDAAMRSAVSTGGNTAQTAEVLAAVMKEFGISGDEAAKTMDQLHIASAEGNTTLEQYSESFGQVAAFSAAVGVPLDQAAAAMAAMTRHGFDAATAATQVKDQIVHLINPSAAAEKTITALSKASGVDLVSAFTATGVHTLGLKGIMDLTTTAMNKVGLSADQQTAEWLKLVPNIRGGAASFVLAGRGAQDFNDILHDIDTSTGVTDEAFQRIETTLNFQWGTATNRLRELSITIGNLLKPALTDVLSHVNDFIASVQSLPESVLQGIVVVTGLAGAAALLVGGFILLAPLGAAIGTAFGAITGILISFAPWVLVVVGAFLALKAAWDSDLGSIKEIADRFSNLGDILQAALSGEVVAAWGGFVEDIKTLDPAIRTVIDNIGDFIGRALELASVLGGQLKSVIDTQLGPALENIGNFMAQNVGPAFDIVAGAVGFLKDTLGGVVTNGLRPLQVIIDAFRANPEALPGFFTSLGDSLVTLGGRVQTVAPVLGSLASLFGAINNLIGTVVQVGFSALIGLFTDVLIPNLDKLRPVLIALAVPLAVAFGPFIAFFKFITDNAGAISKAIDQIAGSINALATAIGTLPANFANLPGVAGATSAAGTALNATSGAAQGALNAGSQLLNNGVNLTINGVTINNAGDLNSFTQAVADAIAGASRRVGPPVSNGGFPAIEGQFT